MRVQKCLLGYMLQESILVSMPENRMFSMPVFFNIATS